MFTAQDYETILATFGEEKVNDRIGYFKQYLTTFQAQYTATIFKEPSAVIGLQL
jgi:hypothetical protein